MLIPKYIRSIDVVGRARLPQNLIHKKGIRWWLSAALDGQIAQLEQAAGPN
jgi:hypothetical protein